MGCQCLKKNEELKEEISKNDENIENIEDIGKNDNLEKKDELIGNSEEKGEEPTKIKVSNNVNEGEEEYNEKINEDKNAKYADYPEKMLELINKIREDPVSYADIIEDSIKNISVIEDDDETKPKIIYKKKVKVALTRGEPAFKEAAEILRNMDSLPPLEFKNEICVPLPDNENDIKDFSYLKEQVKILRESTNIDVFFKDLIKLPEVSALLMIVDDGEKNAGRKRNAVLNKNFKYIGINSKFVGKTFIAYFTFSK
jgi:hypothetical protein